MKITNILMLSVTVAALAACGKSQPDTATPDDATTPTEEAEPADDMLDDEAEPADDMAEEAEEEAAEDEAAEDEAEE